MSAIFNDDFYENHLNAWIDHEFSGEIKKKIKKAMKDCVVEQEIKIEDNISWPNLLSKAIVAGYITEKEAYSDEKEREFINE